MRSDVRGVIMEALRGPEEAEAELESECLRLTLSMPDGTQRESVLVQAIGIALDRKE